MGRFRYWLGAGFLILICNSAYLAGTASPTVFYMGNVAAHLVLGVAMAGGFVWLLARNSSLRRKILPAAGLLLASATLGLILVVLGNTHNHRWILWAHIATAISGTLALLPWLASVASRYAAALRVVVAAGTLLVVAMLALDASGGSATQIRNPATAPLSMEDEGAGPGSPFWPSSAQTNTGGMVPSDFMIQSERCGECHKDIYEQWQSSAHRFSSFNNQFYRKSIEHMQELSGTKGSRWCAGCHDHAMFFSGRFDTPAIEQIDTEEAQAGLGCTSCHAIVHVDGTMGNGGFTIEYPELHSLVAHESPLLRKLHDFLTYADPEPHNRTFLKPFMKGNSEFCSACHKVHLDAPVNNYRWFRGFNSYDNWQASGVSGQGARSFYYPAAPMVCADCHMPLVESDDPGNRDGMVHSHRFPGANTALAHVNRDEPQMRVTRDFLESGFITVDIFAASPVSHDAGLPMLRRAGETPQLMTTFAVAEEAEQSGPIMLREVGDLAAPIDQAGAVFRPGDSVRLDVVVRTRAIGHVFPGGTVDAFDVWLEVQARDSTGAVIFWSGQVEDGGRGPVEPGAHFYRAYLLDGAGNPINKRNAWQARSMLYARQIPPGAADVAHYRLDIPASAQGPITVNARLHYRKFSHYYTQYAYAGKAGAGDAGLNHDSRAYDFSETNIPDNISGKIKGTIPQLPIITLAEATAKLDVGDAGTTTVWKPVVRLEDRERWNDWGIGLLLQGDLKGAEYAFRRVTEAEPDYADGWINVARALIQEGETEAAKPFLARASQINANLGRLRFFQAMAEKADGDYEAALRSLEAAADLYPRDRVVLNQIGRVRFLMRDFQGAVDALQRVLAVDPEDLQAHYTLMLAYRGLGDREASTREQRLFERFKADESSQQITAVRRRLSPEENNERQPIHDHVSVPLRGADATTTSD